MERLSYAFDVGLPIMGLGLGIVFLILLLLWLVLEIMKVIFYDIPNKNALKEKKSKAVSTNVAPSPKVDTVPITVNDDEKELVAVLTAAVAAYMGSSVSAVKINSFRRLNRSGSGWNGVTKM